MTLGGLDPVHELGGDVRGASDVIGREVSESGALAGRGEGVVGGGRDKESVIHWL